MKKIITYIGFIAASAAESAIFFTADNYIQLAAAVLFYLPLAYFAFRLFPRKEKVISIVNNNNTQSTPNFPNPPDYSNHPDRATSSVGGEIEISDINKRAFLKLIGATGLSVFVSSLLSRMFGNRITGQPEKIDSVKIEDPSGTTITPAKHHPTDNYKISEVDYGVSTYYGFIDQNEGWFILKEDLTDGTYRYVKGGTDFNNNWNNRENLKYDYFNRVFSET